MSLNFILHKYRLLGKKGEGTFSEVLKCQNIKDGTYWACKKMKQNYNSLDQVNNLREVQAMRRLSPHDHILELYEVLFDKKAGTLALIVELMDMNIYEMIKERTMFLDEAVVKYYVYMLCKAISHLHRNGIFHRDVKPENILVKDEKMLKLADFGSCRSVYSKQPYTEYISTRWYRAPECLLTDGYYTYKMDIWSVGCVFYEIMSLRPLFPGANEVDQIAKIHDVMGTPDPNVLNKLRKKARGINFNFPQKKGCGLEKLIPHASADCRELIYQMCAYDPDDRISAKQALKHSYFKEFRDDDKRKAVLAKSQRESQQPPQIKIESQEKTKEEQSRIPKDSSATIEKPVDTDNKDNAQDNKSEDPMKANDNISKLPEVKTEKDKQQFKEKDKDVENKTSTPPRQTSKVPSPAVSSVRYPASIVHNSYQKRERERKRRRQRLAPGRMAESGPSPANSFFPKVHTHPKPGSYQSSFQRNPYGGAGHSTLPKLGLTSGPTPAAYLPSLTQAFVKPAKKNVQATKNIYGSYQLPSIGRRGTDF